MPIPHSGPRGSPVADVRQICAAMAIAAATLVPARTATGAPFTVNVTSSGIADLLIADLEHPAVIPI
jgi:hypothetical protein